MRYLIWIRTLGCLVCNKDSEAAYVGLRAWGFEIDDFRALPLCHTHHQTAKNSLTALGYKTFGDFYGLDMQDQIIRHVMQFLDEQLELTDHN